VAGALVGVAKVVFTDTEATKGIMYTPIGVCGETSTLNNGC
jgi:hypothetical protein